MSRFDEPLPKGVRWWLQDGVLVVRSGQKFTGEDLAQAFAEALEATVLRGAVPVLFDNRFSEERASSDEIRARAKRFAEHPELFGPRLAVVVSDALHYGLARMGGALVEVQGDLEVQVFETPDEALDWLREGRPSLAVPGNDLDDGIRKR